MKYIFYALFLFAGIKSAAQPTISSGGFSSGNQQLIENAVKDGVFIVRRCYRLQDNTGAFFGWQNQNYFGETYSIAIKSKEGYYLTDKAIQPWKYDRKFEEHADQNKFKPVLSINEYRNLNDTVYTTLPVRDVKLISKDRIYLAQDIDIFNRKTGINV